MPRKSSNSSPRLQPRAIRRNHARAFRKVTDNKTRKAMLTSTARTANASYRPPKLTGERYSYTGRR